MKTGMRSLFVVMFATSQLIGCGGESADQASSAPHPSDGGTLDVFVHDHDGHSHTPESVTPALDAQAGSSDGAPQAPELAPDGSRGGPASDVPCAATVLLLDYELSPSDVVLPRGHVVLCTRNDGKAPHDLVVRDPQTAEIGRSPVLGPGETARLVLDVAPGLFEMICSRPGHASLGMRGSLHVE